MESLKRDICLIVGSGAILYMMAKVLCIKDIDVFLYGMLLLSTSIGMISMHIILYKRFDITSIAVYRIAAIVFSFQGINMFYGLLMLMIGNRLPVVYMMMLFECNLLELMCIPIFMWYAGKEINKDRIATYIALCFFISILVSKKVYEKFGIQIYNSVMVIIATLLMLSSIIGIYYVKKFKWKLSDKGRKYFYLFFVIRGIYYLLGIYLSFNNNAANSSRLRWILMYIKTSYMYLLGVSLYYNCLQKSWNELVEKTRIAKEKISSNHQDRDIIVNLSHELKTPINVIQSATQILKLDARLDKSAINELKNIKSKCNEAMKLIIHMIDINKIKGGYLKTNFEVYNMVEVLENVIEAFAGLYEEANLIFNTNEEEIKAKIDINLIQRASMYIIGTLLNNGRKDIYMDLEYEMINKAVSVNIYAKEIEQFITEHHRDMAKCKIEEAGDVFALEFIKRILIMHKARISHGGSGYLKITFYNIGMLEEEPIYLEDNIEYLRDQIKSLYYT